MVAPNSPFRGSCPLLDRRRRRSGRRPKPSRRRWPAVIKSGPRPLDFGRPRFCGDKQVCVGERPGLFRSFFNPEINGCKGTQRERRERDKWDQSGDFTQIKSTSIITQNVGVSRCFSMFQCFAKSAMLANAIFELLSSNFRLRPLFFQELSPRHGCTPLRVHDASTPCKISS